MPGTTSTKCAYYADDLALAIQSADFDKLNSTLTDDMKKMEDYFYWSLRPNPTKTTVTAINMQAGTELNVSFCGKPVKNEPLP